MSSTPLRQRVASVSFFIGALAPLLVAWVYKLALRPRPFWAFFYDPELIYFSDGLRLSRGLLPLQAHNPGAPVTLLSGGLAALTGRSILEVDRFRVAAYSVSILLVCVGAWVLFFRVFKGVHPALATLGVWTYCLAPAALEYLSVWSPEILVLPVGALVLWAVASAGEREFGPRQCLALGAATGLACSLKFTFLGWPIAALVALVDGLGRRRAAPAAGALAAGAVGGFVLLTLPLLPRYSLLFGWLLRLASRSGPYGEGPVALPRASEALERLLAFVAAAKAWHILLAVSLAAAVLATWNRRLAPARRALVVFGVVAAVSSYVLTFGRMEPRYLLPSAVAVLGLIPALSSLSVIQPATARAALLVFVALLVGKQMRQEFTTHRARIEGATNLQVMLRSEVRAAAATGPSRVVAYSFRAPIASTALHLLTTDPVDHAAVYQAFPDEGFVDWSGAVKLPPGATTWGAAAIDPRNVAGGALPGRPVGRVGDFEIVVPTTVVDP